MARTTRILSLSLPPKLADTFERLARRKHQDRSGLLREMIAAYEHMQWLERFRSLQSYGARKARDLKAFTEKDIDRLVLEGR
jgi:metal-responsive CopG/Arc/MetJ family transcriptional regulator